MNDENSLDKKKKKLKIYYSLLITVICIIGVSFAWFRLYLSQNEDNTLASRTCFNTTLTEDTSKLAISDAFPISDVDGLKQTPFTFTIKNTCSNYVKVYVTINSTYRTSTSSSYLSDNYLKVNVSSSGATDGPSVVLGAQTLTDLNGSSKGYVLLSAYLGANEEKSFDLRIWMDSATTLEQGLNKTWAGKIVVISDASNQPTVNEVIFANNRITAPVTAPGSEVSAQRLEDIPEEKYYINGESSGGTIMDNGSLLAGAGKMSLLGLNQVNTVNIAYADSWTPNGTGFDLVDATIVKDSYDDIYTSLVGKYINWSSLMHTIRDTDGGTIRDTDMAYEMVSLALIRPSTIATTELTEIFYITAATADVVTFKTISSNKISSENEEVLASAEDDYGTSYYFRGAVKNNYVQFANKCWRIVRTLGNGSMKLVLHNNNSSGVSNPCSSANNDPAAAFIGTGVYNTASANTYVGFMYGESDSTDYSVTHANTNKSAILSTLETWYKENLSAYDEKIDDAIWCNDKSNEETTAIDAYEYGAYTRLVTNRTASLKCQSDNNGGKLSKFTVSDTENGNGKLTYKIGLLTADEVAFAGMSAGKINPLCYLNENASGGSWWTLSPYDSQPSRANIFTVTSSVGTFGLGNVANSKYIRPSIVLSSSAALTGKGTSDSPYIVK